MTDSDEASRVVSVRSVLQAHQMRQYLERSGLSWTESQDGGVVAFAVEADAGEWAAVLEWHRRITQ